VAKCVIVPLWKYQESAIRDALNDVCPGWHTMKIAEVPKYLGFWIGPGTGDRDWDGIMDTLRNVGRAIRGAGLPRLMAFRSFLAYGVSHLIFVAQLRRPPKSFHELELQNIRDVIRGPGLWAPASFFYYLKDWGLFPCQLRAYESWCRATMLRTVLQTHWNWRELFKQLYDPSCLRDDDLFVFPYPQWKGRLAVSNYDAILSGFDVGVFMQSVPRLRSYSVVDLPSCPDLQRLLYNYELGRRFPFSLVDFLCKKLARWTSVARAQAFAAIAIDRIALISKSTPPCVQFCWIETICNAWPTAARFQGTGPCFLQCSRCGCDSLEHYSLCPVV